MHSRPVEFASNLLSLSVKNKIAYTIDFSSPWNLNFLGKHDFHKGCLYNERASFSLEQLPEEKQTARHVAFLYPLLHTASSQRSIRRNFQ